MQVFAVPRKERKKFSLEQWLNEFLKIWLSDFDSFGAIKLKTKLRIC